MSRARTSRSSKETEQWLGPTGTCAPGYFASWIALDGGRKTYESGHVRVRHGCMKGQHRVERKMSKLSNCAICQTAGPWQQAPDEQGPRPALLARVNSSQLVASLALRVVTIYDGTDRYVPSREPGWE